MRALVFWLALLVLAAGGGYWWFVVRHRRLTEWARVNGWTYVGSDDSLVTLGTRYPFGRGERQHAGEVMRGRFGGVEAVSFAYSWHDSGGRRSDDTVHLEHVVALRLPAYLPIVEVRPENVVDKVATAFGGQDINFELEAFNRAFRVQAFDERTAHAVIHPRLMERLLQADARHVQWRIEGTWIVSWQGGVTDLSSLAPRFTVLSAVAGSVPRHVWLDHGYDPLAPPSGEPAR